MTPERTLEWDWFPGKVPKNVVLHETAYLETTYSFELCRSLEAEAVQIGRGSSIYLGVMFDLGPTAKVNIGQFTLMNGSRIICDSAIHIGDYCLLSWNTVLMDSYRVPVESPLRRVWLEKVAQRALGELQPSLPAKPIHIANNVWIGFDSCVMAGVRIGEGSIVGARSVVVEDVPPFTAVAGNPARIIRQLEPGNDRSINELSFGSAEVNK
jgi:acetyltransferase-like isoleucine patch superfamily enzyme